MIPIGDSVRSRSVPYVNVAIIALNVLVFAYELTLGTLRGPLGGLSELERFFFDWGSIPACLVDWAGFSTDVPPRQLDAVCPSGVDNTPPIFTSMFLHGGWFHLIGNMIFLWVFGDNVEDAMGHIGYVAFYVVVGMAATASHIAVSQNELAPAIGASGAIAGVLGAYALLYPRATVSAVFPILPIIWLPFKVPALFLIGLWFAMQLLNGFAALASADVVGAGGGVAWFAHIGGFVAGLVLVRLFTLGRRRRPPLSVAR